MNTYAPSLTNRFAVARPMPLLAPVISAIFPSSLPIWFSLVVISLAVLCERRRSALPSPRSHPNEREQQSLSDGRRTAYVGAPSPTPRAPHLDSSASACSHSFFPACRNSSLSRVPATARDNDSAPYIRAINPSAFSRPSTPASSISESDPAKPDNSFSSALRYGSPSRATSGAALGSKQPVSLLSRCLRDRYCLITPSARARGESPREDFKRESQVALAALRSASTKSSSFESKWL